MKLLNEAAATTWLELSFLLGSIAYTAGCIVLILDNVSYFVQGVILFIVGSAFFMVGPIGKTMLHVVYLVRNIAWKSTRKEKQFSNHLFNHDDYQSVNQLVENEEIESSDLPSLGMICLELFNDFIQLIGGVALTVGSCLYMVKPEPLYLVYLAVSNWLAGSLLFLFVACIQFGMKQYELLKNSKRNDMSLTCSCCISVGFDVSAFVLNIVSCLLFSMGSTCFYFVNNRSMEIAGEVIWSMGCVAVVMSIACSRVSWIDNCTK